MRYYLAIDLGATSGRHILAHKENGELVLQEVYRFATGMNQSKDDLVWDIPNLFKEVKLGIKKAFEITKDIVSLSIDTWGVDYVLMNGDKEIPPFYSYRNKRLETAYKQTHKVVPFEELYRSTGIQFVPFNTVYQLYSDLLLGRLDQATDFLMIPEYLIYKLTGKKVHEYTIQSTTGLLNAKTKEYDFEIIDKLGLPRKLFTKISPSGTKVAKLMPKIEKEVGGNLDVVLCASHDTGSAFEAVDCDEDSAIISSGTWSILGVKSKESVTDEKALKANFTNEGGVNYIRLCTNIMGMWIVNEISRQKSINLVEICQKLDDIEYKEIFDVNDSSLTAPSNMEEAVRVLLKGREPKNDEELFASCYHSLAYCYDKEIKLLENVTGKKYKSIYIVGGGAKNKYLNKLVEKYTNKKVVALPIEATSIGNIKVQMNATK